MRRITASIPALIWIILLASSCADDKGPSSPDTGSITARAVWVGGPAAALSVPGSTRYLADASVVTVRVIVSASDMATMQQDFAASAGSGVIEAVPAGTDRTLTLEGLDAGGTRLFQGSVSGITVVAGQTADVGTVLLNFLGSLGVLVSPTNGLVLTEAGGTAGFSVVLSGPPSNDVQIPISSSDPGEALMRGGDSPSSFTGAITLTFTAADWFTAQAVEVQGQDDALLDGNVSAVAVTGLVASADAGYAGLNPSDVQVTNIDDEVAGILVAPTSGLVTNETGTFDSFDVVLNELPNANVSVDITSGDTTEALVKRPPDVTPVTTLTLTFTPGN